MTFLRIRKRAPGPDLAEVTLVLLAGPVRLSVADRGVGFDFTGVDLYRRPGLSDPGGRGLYLISCVMDSVHVEGGNCTTITMTKNLRPDNCFPQG